MVSAFGSLLIAGLLFFLNLNIKDFLPAQYQSRLICVNNYTKFLSFGNDPQIADAFWIRFLQELDAFNTLTIAEPHLCPDKTSSWHFHIMNIAIDIDPKFYEVTLNAPLLISVTIGDAKGASILFDKAVKNYPNDWMILYRASYQAQIEERDHKKAADLLYRAGKNGAPKWVMSLAGGLFNEVGDRVMAEKIYAELLKDLKDEELAKRLKLKLDNKIKNYYDSNTPKSDDKEKGKK